MKDLTLVSNRRANSILFNELGNASELINILVAGYSDKCVEADIIGILNFRSGQIVVFLRQKNYWLIKMTSPLLPEQVRAIDILFRGDLFLEKSCVGDFWRALTHVGLNALVAIILKTFGETTTVEMTLKDLANHGLIDGYIHS